MDVIGGASNTFFVGWSGSYSDTPIHTQPNSGPDSRQYRQYIGGAVDAGVLAFATANPGKLYIAGDEPDQACTLPYDYAGTYHDFVAAIRGADPTARFSPAGIADPNDQCCPPPGGEPCRSNMHYTSYALQFYNAYIQRYGVAPPVNEWRFHNFAQWLGDGDINTWWTEVSNAAAWSVAHGANMVLGSWGFIGWDINSTNMPLYLSEMKQTMAYLVNDTRINQAAWWSYENTGYPHYLKNSDGTLTQEGQQYASVLPADIASSVTLVGSAGAHAKIQWTNTYTWAIEAEFWRQPGGVGSYVYNNTNYVAVGGTQTPVNAYSFGDRIKGRVRYYNRLGAGTWSAFSNIVLMH
jgi:hypothetical protein